MKKILVQLLLGGCLFHSAASYAGNIWRQVNLENAPTKLQMMHPKQFLVYTMDEASLKFQMWNLSTNPDEGMIISLPLPDGSARNFRVWQTPMMPDDLAARYPDIKTFTAEAVDNRNVTAKIDFTLFGFHAMIFDGDNTAFVDPFDNYRDGFYMVHYKRDEVRPLNEMMKCGVVSEDEPKANGIPVTLPINNKSTAAAKVINGYNLRTYRLALAADNFYCAAVGGTTIPLALSKMTTTMNRINGVYERELSITMKFVSNEDQIIWTTPTGGPNGDDPFNAIDANPNACLPVNQTQCDTRIGAANYDIGHVFTTNGGGLSLRGVVCTSGSKAQSVTGSPSPTGDGFDIDFVAHEMGHEFNGGHTYNNGSDGNCGGGNRVRQDSYEPGSGSTIMAYAGICSPDDLQLHSDPYFHALSLLEIQAYVSAGGNCAEQTSSNNKSVAYDPFQSTYTIPYKTPFELIGPALTDSVADTATLYCWEEWDRDMSANGTRFINTTTVGPLFRSYSPTRAKTRVFPKISMVLAGTLSNAGMEGNEGEKVPTTTRQMVFRCTFRDIMNNLGVFTFPTDSIVIHAQATTTNTGFTVTSQNATVPAFDGGSTATVTWDVVGTDGAPYNAANVDIYLGTNGSNFPYYAGTFPNNGSATITVPNPPATSSTCRFKVKGSGNVFFNVNGKNFTVKNNPSLPVAPNVVQQVATQAQEIKVYPVPANNVLHISTVSEQAAIVVNAIGQRVWEGKINGKADLSVASWAKGVYYVRFIDAVNGNKSVKQFIVE